MSETLLASLNLCAEVALVLALISGAGRALDTRARILIQRCAFVLAIAAPLTLVIGAPEGALFTAAPGTGAAAALSGATTSSIRGWPFLWTAMALIWFAGFAIVLARAAISHLTLSGFFARAEHLPADLAPIAEALRRRLAPHARILVRVSSEVRAPCMFGALRCKVLLPAGLPPGDVRAVLAHEFCHVRAGDALWLSISQIVCAMYWFNPLAWLIAREHRDDIETVCDDETLSGGVDVYDYVHALVSAAGEIARPAASSAIAMSQRGLTARVRALLHRSSPMPLPTLTQRALMVGAVCGLAALLAAGDLVSARERVVPEAGNGLIYVHAGAGVEARIGTIAMCGNDADCVFELPLGQQVIIQATASRAGELRWSGCAPSGDRCATQISNDPVTVSVRLR